jgi:tetratricopeptide (TPR) repeat protein
MILWLFGLIVYLSFSFQVFGQENDLRKEAECLYWQGDFAAAVTTYRQILKEDPRSCSAHYGLGRSFLKDEKVSETHTATEEALRQCSSDPRIFSLAGDLFFREADFQKSLHFYQEAITADPNNARGHFGIGKILLSEFN